MNAQDIILGSRVAHVRELKTELANLKSQNATLREENALLKSHFDMALLAAIDLSQLQEGGKFVIVDGWNAILGAQKTAHNPNELIEFYNRYLLENPLDFVWIVFDGHRENSKTSGRMRISYTGGVGAHRADRFICDFLRMAKFSSDLSKIVVKTCDKDFAKDIKRITAN